MVNKKPRKPSLLVAVRRGPDMECPECFGYPFHEKWCRKIQGD